MCKYSTGASNIYVKYIILLNNFIKCVIINQSPLYYFKSDSSAISEPDLTRLLSRLMHLEIMCICNETKILSFDKIKYKMNTVNTGKAD